MAGPSKDLVLSEHQLFRFVSIRQNSEKGFYCLLVKYVARGWYHHERRNGRYMSRLSALFRLAHELFFGTNQTNQPLKKNVPRVC